MFKLDDDLLKDLGLGGLPPHEKNKMLQHIYETLEMRVGVTLAEQMSNEQLDEFEEFIDRNDEAGALKWLETNFPNYKDVVAAELEKLKAEIRAAAPQILAAAQQAAQMQAYQFQQMQAQQQAMQQMQPGQPPMQQQPPAGDQQPPAQQPPMAA
jgi:hypothetical protein